MGLSDNFFSSTAATQDIFTPSNEQAAWVSIVYASASIDGEVSDIERDAFCQLLLFKALFRGHDLMEYFREVIGALSKFTPKQIIDGSIAFIGKDNRATLFCIVTETLLSDNIIRNEENELLEYLAKALELDEQVATMIIEVMMIRNSGNVKFS
jgi:hypothetical protein